MFSLLDGFSSYNQVLVAKLDRLKMTFRMKWGTFSYRCMPFGLINVGATFQRGIDVSFKGIILQRVVVYLDDVPLFSKKRSYHVHHLKKIFESYNKYSISLNPKKIIFTVSERDLLVHIRFKSGIMIDPKCVKAIMKIPHPNDKKAMHSFLGKIHFIHKFISDFAQMVKPLHNMIKKDVAFKLIQAKKEAFDCIKKSIVEFPALYSPDFNK